MAASFFVKQCRHGLPGVTAASKQMAKDEHNEAAEPLFLIYSFFGFIIPIFIALFM